MDAPLATPPPSRTPWTWVPSLYFAQGVPYVVATTMSVILYKRLGVSNADIALYTSWLYLPWVIKPLWSPVVELLGTRRQWVVATQLLLGAALGCVALTLPGPAFFKVTLGLFWLLAFASATHDIAADGFYMLALDPRQQAWFVGVRSTAYRLAMIAGQGLLIMLAGAIETRTGVPALEVQLSGRPGAQVTATLDPAAVRLAEGGGPVRLVATPPELVLDTAPTSAGEVNDLVARARQWNQAAGFSARPEAKAGAAEPSWWSGSVAKPLAAFLRDHFGAAAASTRRSDLTGQAGAFLVSLSARPEKDVVVNLGRESGDKGARLLEGERFTFTSANWDKPVMAVVQLDPKVRGASEATFVARAGDIPFAWSVTFYALAALFLLFFAYHRFLLPRPAGDAPKSAPRSSRRPIAEFFATFGSFFRKPLIVRSLAFLLFYRLAEAQLVKVASLFLLDSREAGGLGLSTSAVGFVYGTVGVAALTVGGLLGGFALARRGLKFWLPFMVCAIHLPNLVFVNLAYALPESLWLITLAVAVEQFGYGFGLSAYAVYTLHLAQGEHQTAHYAIGTGFMALGMMVPGMFAGWLQEAVGYQHFFVWIMICTIPGFLVAALIRPEAGLGKKTPSGG